MLEDFTKEYLTIKVGETYLELLPMGDLPARKVMEMLSSKNQDRLQNSLELMKLAARNPTEFETEANFISFNELILAIDLWMDKSSDYANSIRSKMEKKSSVVRETGEKKRKSDRKKVVDEILADLESTEGSDLEIASGIANAIMEAGVENVEELGEDAVVLIISKWFVKNGKAELLIENGLLTEKSRTGKYYPIIDGRVARRLGFEMTNEGVEDE